MKIYIATSIVISMIQFQTSACSIQRSATKAIDLVGGIKAGDSEFPSVFVWSTGSVTLSDSFCTATKIADNKILTAGHCVLIQEQSDVPYTGSWQYDESLEVGKFIHFSKERTLTRSSEKYKLEIQKLWLPTIVEGCLKTSRSEQKCRGRVPIPDIAIIEILPTEAFSSLPIAQMNYDKISANESIVVMGFGSTGERSTANPYLKYHSSEVATKAELASALKGTESDRDGIPDSEMFFGTLGYLISRDFANLGSGDSGGPAMIKVNGQYGIIGINSDGFCSMQNSSEYANCQKATNSYFQRVNKGSSHGVGEWLSKVLKN